MIYEIFNTHPALNSVTHFEFLFSSSIVKESAPMSTGVTHTHAMSVVCVL